ncbi:MAG: thioredoxin [Chloroflexota bacterium]
MSNSDYVQEVSEGDFEITVIAKSREIPVVVDFWAPWCGPCRVLGPILEKLAVEGKGSFLLAKLNVDENPSLSAQYNIRGIPAVKAFRDGMVVAEFVGAMPEPKVREFINKVAPSQADRDMDEAQSLLATRHWAQAEAAFRTVLLDRPDNAAATLGLVKALLAQGKGCEVEELLENFPGGSEIATAEKLKPLAHLLCEVEPSEPPICESELDALFYQSGRLLARGQWEAGMDGLLETLRRDKKYRKGEPRLIMLGIFELFGEDDPHTREYRQELASVLF